MSTTETPIFHTRLTQKKQIARDLLELHFDRPAGFDFLAGQFVQFLVPDGDKELLRSYSLAGTPTEPSLIFCVKLLKDGKASAMFARMSVGDTARFKGPRGRFIVDQNGPAHLFVATGAGLAPIMGMIRDELENKKTVGRIRLLFGVRSQEDMFWTDALNELQQTFPHFSYHLTLSQPDQDQKWTGHRGRVTEHTHGALTAGGKDSRWYLCGSTQMVKDMRGLLTNAGVDSAHIQFEIF